MNTIKKIFLLLIVLVFSGVNNAQSSSIEGIWKLSKINEGAQTYPMNMTVHFNENGQITLHGRDAGTWTRNATDKILHINSDYLLSLNGVNTIKNHINNELTLLNNKGDTNTLSRMSLPKDKELDNKVVGDWFLQQIEKEGEINFVGQLVDFNKNGILYIQDMIFGTWAYNKSKKLIQFDTDKIKGDYEILKNKKNELIISQKAKKLHFIKIDQQKINKENAASGLLGIWEFEQEPDSDIKRYLTFEEPDTFKLLEKGEGMTSKSDGKWIFDEHDKTLILIGQIEKLRGLSKVTSITNQAFSVLNKGEGFTFKKVIQNAANIERLSYTSEDFYDQNGDYKYYDDEEKLPWKDPYAMIAAHVNVKQLLYKFSTLIESTKSFEIKTLNADVMVNQEEEILRIDNIFSGFDRYNTPDDYEFPSNYYNFSNKLYPIEGDTFRVLGTEEITVPAGIFTCTIIEATASFDESVKIWMINDKLGVFAKLVKDIAGNNGHYQVYELQEIKNK